VEGKEPLASFSRTPTTTSEFYPAFERYVLYDRLPFLRPGINESSDSASEAGGGSKR